MGLHLEGLSSILTLNSASPSPPEEVVLSLHSNTAPIVTLSAQTAKRIKVESSLSLKTWLIERLGLSSASWLRAEHILLMDKEGKELTKDKIEGMLSSLGKHSHIHYKI